MGIKLCCVHLNCQATRGGPLNNLQLYARLLFWQNQGHQLNAALNLSMHTALTWACFVTLTVLAQADIRTPSHAFFDIIILKKPPRFTLDKGHCTAYFNSQINDRREAEKSLTFATSSRATCPSCGFSYRKKMFLEGVIKCHYPLFCLQDATTVLLKSLKNVMNINI